MNNIVQDRSLGLKIYKALRKDFKHILILYTKAECWGYQLMCWLSRYFGATLTYHLASTKKGNLSERLEHRNAVIRLILMTAKDYWLMKRKKDEPKIVFKQRLGAMFLTHILYNSQPAFPENRLKIQMDSADINALKSFEMELKMYMHVTDFDVGGYKFFEACLMISQKIKSEAIEVCAVACEYGLYDELPLLRQQSEKFMPPIKDLVMTYFKLHEYVKMLEFEGNNQGVAYDYKVRLPPHKEVPGQARDEPFIEILEEMILKTEQWEEPGGREPLSNRIAAVFKTSMTEAASLSLYLLTTVSTRRYSSMEETPLEKAQNSDRTIAPAEYQWEPATPERDYFKRDGQCNLEKFFSRYDLSCDDFGIDELRFLDELRAAPTQLILPLPKPPPGAQMELTQAAVAMDHTYSMPQN